MQGAPLQRCAQAGCAAGSEAVQVVGAELSPASWKRLRAKVDALVAGRGAASLLALVPPPFLTSLESQLKSLTVNQKLMAMGVPLALLGLALMARVKMAK